MKNGKKDQSIEVETREDKLRAEIQWDIYRQQLADEPKGSRETLYNDDNEYLDEVLNQLKDYQSKLEQQEERNPEQGINKNTEKIKKSQRI